MSLKPIEGVPDCKCGNNHWIPIPDSLAIACMGDNGCGRVLVRTFDDKWEKGASIQKWLSDIHPDLPPLKDPDEEE